jgi:retron-type reverse transcriptase
VYHHKYEEIISLENLLEAWCEFRIGKKLRQDVQEFEHNLMSELIILQESLENGTYQHSPYQAFIVNDPKRRSIHKASVADRVLHRAIYRQLYTVFDTQFIEGSFSSRRSKGVHKALEQFMKFSRGVSVNYHKTAWVLKCDIRQFFASIDHRVLTKILKKYIDDDRLLNLLAAIIGSFSASTPGVGLPLGNLTSQLLANVYLNEMDQFIKHELKVKYYVRYADDFVLMSRDRAVLKRQLYLISDWLGVYLQLFIHPKKLSIATVASGVDFLGWVHFPHHRTLRTVTKRRMMMRLKMSNNENGVASYLGLLGYGDGYKIAVNVVALQELSGHAKKEGEK